MSWIKEINYSEADSKLKQIYDRVKSPQGTIDNVLSVHSQRPHTLTGHISLYKNVLHHSNNTLPKWFLEAIGVYVSVLNGCAYCVTHHAEGVKKNSADENDAAKIIACLQEGLPENFFSGFFLEGLLYARKLTLFPSMMQEEDIRKLQHAGFSDGEILEINQVCAYFNYANRTVLGLGVDITGDVIGHSPNNSEAENW